MSHWVRVLLFISCLAASVVAQQPSTPVDSTALYEKAMNEITGTGVSRNDVTAVEHFRQSADLGYAPAQDVMGYFAETGGVVPQDAHVALVWYRKAATQGDPMAQWVVGRMYFTGTGDVRDLNAAESWLKQAAEQGNPFGQLLLGSLYLERGNYVFAAKHFQQAAEQGLPEAQQQLGLLLKTGRGTVAEDQYAAYIWLLLAFEAGEHSLAIDITQLEGELGSTNVERAKTEVRDKQKTLARPRLAHGCTGWPGEFNLIPSTPPPDVQKFCR